MDTQHIQIADFDYNLPDCRIAKFPLKERDHSKLLVCRQEQISSDIFYNLPAHIPSGALMVFNNTKVIQARLHFKKPTGALIEVFLLEPYKPADYEQTFQTRNQCSWLCLVGNQKKWKEGELTCRVECCGQFTMLSARRSGQHGASQQIDFSWDNPAICFADILDALGELPIPPYLNRKTEESDKTTYQTVYSRIKGSVAAPTAGLHFTEKVLQTIDQKGIQRSEVTLHVGAGTFRPVKSREIADHEMHAEFFTVQKSTIEQLLRHEGKVVAVGTTSVRTLESLYYIGCQMETRTFSSDSEFHVSQWEPYEGNQAEVDLHRSLSNILQHMSHYHLNHINATTQIIIAPGYEFKVVNMLVTNFHQPKSTLLLLVSAFLHGKWKAIYDYALSNDFRFLSYGDCCLLIP